MIVKLFTGCLNSCSCIQNQNCCQVTNSIFNSKFSVFLISGRFECCLSSNNRAETNVSSFSCNNTCGSNIGGRKIDPNFWRLKQMELLLFNSDRLINDSTSFSFLKTHGRPADVLTQSTFSLRALIKIKCPFTTINFVHELTNSKQITVAFIIQI